MASQTGTIHFKNRRLFTLALKGSKSPFGLTQHESGISVLFAFTTQKRANAEAERGLGGVKKDEFDVCSIDGHDLLKSITSGELADTCGYHAIMFDGVPIPLTQEGARWLAAVPTPFPGLPPDPEVWAKVQIPASVWAEGAKQASAETHWKVLMVRSLYLVLGEDFDGIEWEGPTPSTLRDLGWGGSGMGKTTGGWSTGPEGEA
jgi:hypothetical protein